MPRPPILGFLLLISIAALASVESLIALSPVNASAMSVVTRVYDVNALVGNIPEASGPDVAREHRVQHVMQQVETIAPLSWKDRGGIVGTMRELQGCLIVTHTPAVQRRIAALLSEEYRKRGLTFGDNALLRSSRAISCSFSGLAPATVPSTRPESMTR